MKNFAGTCVIRILIVNETLLYLGLWGEIRNWEDGTTIVQKTHDANQHHVQVVSFFKNCKQTADQKQIPNYVNNNNL